MPADGTGEHEPATTIGVSIVEDHPMFRQVLVLTLQAEPGIEVEQAVPAVSALAPPRRPDPVLVLDFYTPGVSGIDAVRAMTAAGYRVLVLSATERPDHVLGSLEAGAVGFLTKAADCDQVVWAVRRVAEGSFYVAPSIAALLFEQRHKARPASAVKALTDRERQVLRLVAEGLTDQETAERLRIGVRTVRSHLDHIRTKTGRRRRAELTRLAMDEGVIAT